MSNIPFHQAIIIITGPTASGKTDFALELASHIPSEIINMDMGQMYTPFSIGTAKPEWRDCIVPHHMFDIINTPRNYTVVEYRNAVLKLITALWERKKIPIVIGGSMFYLKSLFFPPDQYVAQDKRAHFLQHDHTKESTQMLWERLFAIDPLRAQKINITDRYRIERALSVWETTGIKPSECTLQYTPPSPSYLLLYITRDRKELYERIDQRVLAMIKQGWLDEVYNFIGTEWQDFIQNKKIIGYNELVQFLTSMNKSDAEYEKVISLIQQRSRHYAKRQETFWRSLKKELERYSNCHNGVIKPIIKEINMTHVQLHECIEAIKLKLSNKE